MSSCDGKLTMVLGASSGPGQNLVTVQNIQSNGCASLTRLPRANEFAAGSS